MTGPEIAMLRISLQLTQAQLAVAVGVHHMTVSKWENGRLAPSAYQIALMRSFRKAALYPELLKAGKAYLDKGQVARALHCLITPFGDDGLASARK